MKKTFFIGCLLSIIAGTASAQYTISIASTEFNIELNDRDMTAAIRDYKYKKLHHDALTEGRGLLSL